jgi:hypothetical protein
MLTIPGHKGNTNQNHIKIPPHSLKQQRPVGEGDQELEKRLVREELI